MEAQIKLIEKLKELVEDYRRRLNTSYDMIEKMIEQHEENGSLLSVRKKERLTTKASVYRTFLTELEKIVIEQIAEGKEIPEMFIAKSGRKYRHIPDDMDIETWDAMTPVQRLEYKGVLRNAPVFASKEIPAGAEVYLRKKHGEQDYADIPYWHIEDMEEYASIKVKEAMQGFNNLKYE